MLSTYKYDRLQLITLIVYLCLHRVGLDECTAYIASFVCDNRHLPISLEITKLVGYYFRHQLNIDDNYSAERPRK